MTKFSGHIVINRPQDVVAQYFVNPDYLKEYQEGFLRKEPISGEPQQAGAVSKMLYEMNGREMELIETIVSNHLPDSFEAFYHHTNMDNTMKCNFSAIDNESTLFEYEFDYVRVSWVLPKLMMLFFPVVFRKQGERWMNNFKRFVEGISES